MRPLVECLLEWLDVRRIEGKPYALVLALAKETLKVVDSPDTSQREFNALDLAQAAEMHPSPVDFDAAKRWVNNSKFATFLDARTRDVESFFVARGHTRCLRLAKRSSPGKHKAHWYLEPYDIPQEPMAPDDQDSAETVVVERAEEVAYDYAPPGSVKPAWWARPFLGAGSIITRSPRGLLWAALLILLVLELLVCLLVLWGHTYVRRPIQVNDVAGFLGVMGAAWLIWRFQLEPLVRLVDDRLIPAGNFWTAMKEDPAQLELAKDGTYQILRLVRYTAVCPVCAGTVELRYSQGANQRRIVGCCSEAPQDHIFSFDRIRRVGRRVEAS